jgi:hypothetical protein
MMIIVLLTGWLFPARSFTHSLIPGAGVSDYAAP